MSRTAEVEERGKMRLRKQISKVKSRDAGRRKGERLVGEIIKDKRQSNRYGETMPGIPSRTYACIIVQLCRYGASEWRDKREINLSVSECGDNVHWINYAALHLSIKFRH